MTSYYCALCALTSAKSHERLPTKHAYCISASSQCFSRHIAACYHYQHELGAIAEVSMVKIAAGLIVSILLDGFLIFGFQFNIVMIVAEIFLKLFQINVAKFRI